MITVHIELQIVRGTTVLGIQPSLALNPDTLVDIRIPHNNHKLVVAISDMRILLVLCRHIAASQLNVVIVAKDGKGTAKQGVLAVSVDKDPRMTSILPHSGFKEVTAALVNFCGVPVDSLYLHNASVIAYIIDLCRMVENIVVGFKDEFDLGVWSVDGEGYFKVRKGVYTLRSAIGPNSSIFDETDGWDGASVYRVGYIGLPPWLACVVRTYNQSIDSFRLLKA